MAKFLKTTIQVNFDADSQLEEATQIHLLLKFCYYQTTTVTSGPPHLISQLFHAVFFA